MCSIYLKLIKNWKFTNYWTAKSKISTSLLKKYLFIQIPKIQSKTYNNSKLNLKNFN